MVPMLQCGLLLSNFSFAIISLQISESPDRELNPRPLPYQGSALPLSYLGKITLSQTQQSDWGSWVGVVSNHCRHSQRIYSPSPLTTRAPTLLRAKDRNRTYDQLITNQLLYQLSYFGIYNKAITSMTLERAKCRKDSLLLSMKINILSKKNIFSLKIRIKT